MDTLKGQICDLTKISNVDHDRSALIVEKLQLLGCKLITEFGRRCYNRTLVG